MAEKSKEQCPICGRNYVDIDKHFNGQCGGTLKKLAKTLAGQITIPAITDDVKNGLKAEIIDAVMEKVKTFLSKKTVKTEGKVEIYPERMYVSTKPLFDGESGIEFIPGIPVQLPEEQTAGLKRMIARGWLVPV